MEILLLTFHTSAALGSMAACFGALYIYMFEFQPRVPLDLVFEFIQIYRCFNSIFCAVSTLDVVHSGYWYRLGHLLGIQFPVGDFLQQHSGGC
jgi:hypothetical protein